MTRVRFSKSKQRKFLKNVKLRLGGTWDGVSKVCKVHPRTVRDWAREKYNMSYEAVRQLSNATKHSIPRGIRILPEYWSVKKASRLGGRKRFELYGPPGTIESRQKGGLIAQKRLRLDPDAVKRRGLIARKRISYPRRSTDLAEFIGIMLGDGGVSSNYQVSISFNPKEDINYAYYVQKLINKLFSLSTVIRTRDKYGSGDIIATGRNLVEFLKRCGIKKGNKVTYKIDIPRWIWSSERYKIACLRGLVDTDGCFYHHRYRINGKEYAYLKMCFTSYSPPLLKSVMTMLEDLNLRPKNTAKNRVYLYSADQLHRYFRRVGSSNPRYLNTYNNFCNTL